MRAAFYSVKGTGHVNPTLPLVRALIERGHEVVYTLTPEWEERVLALGARYRNTGQGPFTTADYNPGQPFWLQLLPAAAAVAPRLVEEARELRPDVVVYDSAAPWGFVVGKVLGCPTVCSVSTLAFGVEETRRSFSSSTRQLDERNESALRELQSRWGVDLRERNVGMFYADDNLVYSSPEINGPTAGLYGRFHFVGPLIRTQDADAELTAHGLATRDALRGRRRIYVAMGTMAGEVRNLDARFFLPFIEAFGDDDRYELVLSVGKTVPLETLGRLPANVIARPSVPQVSLLGHVDAFVSHMGANSMHEGLFHGVPFVCIPCFGDQPGNARRVIDEGAGVELPLEAVSAERARSAVTQVLENPTYRGNALRLQRGLRACGGIEQTLRVLGI